MGDMHLVARAAVGSFIVMAVRCCSLIICIERDVDNFSDRNVFRLLLLRFKFKDVSALSVFSSAFCLFLCCNDFCNKDSLKGWIDNPIDNQY